MSNYISIWGTLVDASFGGTDLSDYEFYCYDFVKGLLPGQKEIVIDIPNMSGLIQAKKKFIPRPIKAYGYLNCSSHADLITKIQNLSGFLYNDNDQQLILSNEDDRYYNAQYIDYVEVWRKKDYAKIILVFNCNDPFAYDTTPDSGPDESPSVNPITVKDTTFIIANDGHYYAWPVVTITLNQAQTHIYVENNNIVGNRFDIAKSFGTGDTLEIDSKDETIKLNGVLSPIGFGDGGESKAEFILLAKGNNEIQVGTEDDDIDISINFSFRKVYLY